jgi:hypothetical protein
MFVGGHYLCDVLAGEVLQSLQKPTPDVRDLY